MSYGMCKQNSNSTTKSVSLEPTIENSMDETAVFNTEAGSSTQSSFSDVPKDKVDNNVKILSTEDDAHDIDHPSEKEASRQSFEKTKAELLSELPSEMASFPDDEQTKCKVNLIPDDNDDIEKEKSSCPEPRPYYTDSDHTYTYKTLPDSDAAPQSYLTAIVDCDLDIKSEPSTKADMVVKKSLGNSEPISEGIGLNSSNNCTECIITEPQSISCIESLKMIERSLPASNGSVSHKNLDHKHDNSNQKNDGCEEVKWEDANSMCKSTGTIKALQEQKKLNNKTNNTMKSEASTKQDNKDSEQTKGQIEDKWQIAEEVEITTFPQIANEEDTCFGMADFIINNHNSIITKNDFHDKEHTSEIDQPRSASPNLSQRIEVQVEDKDVKNGHTYCSHSKFQSSKSIEKKKESDEKISDLGTSCTSSELPQGIIRCQLSLKRSSGKYDDSDTPIPKESKVKEMMSILKKDVVRPAKKLRKAVTFNDVDTFYFFRRQNKTTVPTEGGSSLGMAEKHHRKKSFSIDEHRRRRLRHRSRLSYRQERDQRLTVKMRELKRDRPQLSAYAQLDYVREHHFELIPGDSSDSEHESELNFPDDELDQFAECHRLTTISPKKRRFLLRLAKTKINSNEKLDNQIARDSRARCGCDCENFCYPDICSCHISGIPCQYDREEFPCGCTKHGCGNTNGRVQFDSERVRLHYDQVLDRRPSIPIPGMEKLNFRHSFSSIATTSAGPADPRVSPYVTMIQEDGDASGNNSTRRRPRRLAVKMRENMIRDVAIPPIRDVPVPPPSVSVMLTGSHANGNNGTTSTTPPLVPPYQSYQNETDQNCGPHGQSVLNYHPPGSPPSGKYCSEILSIKRDSMRKIFLAQPRNRNRQSPFLTTKGEKSNNGGGSSSGNGVEGKFFPTSSNFQPCKNSAAADDTAASTTEKPTTTDIRVAL